MVLLRYPLTFSDSFQAAFGFGRHSFYGLYYKILSIRPLFYKFYFIDIQNFTQFDLKSNLLNFYQIVSCQRLMLLMYIIVDKTLLFTKSVELSIIFSMFIYTIFIWQVCCKILSVKIISANKFDNTTLLRSIELS